MQLIGIMGPAGSGKGFVAEYLRESRGFLHLSFADRMKVYAKELYGLPSEDLWGDSEARGTMRQWSEEEWIKLFSGFSKYSNELLSELFGDRMRDADLMTRAYDGLIDLFRKMKLTSDHRGITARYALQLLGTDWGRSLDEGVWVKFLYDKVIPSLGKREPQHRFLRDVPGCAGSLGRPLRGVVVSDHRFANEVAETIGRGGTVYRVRIDGKEAATPPGGVPGHASEVSQQGIHDSRIVDIVLPYGKEKAQAYLNEVMPK